MNLKKYLDAVNKAEARVRLIAAQIDEHFQADRTDEALALKAELDEAKAQAKDANELYLSMLNATSGNGNDPAQRFMPATSQAGSGVDVILDEGDQPFENDGSFFMAVKNAALYPAREDPRLRSRKVKDATGMSEGVPADGGYLLRPQTSEKILENMYQTGEILSRVSKDPIEAGSNSITYNGVDETSRVNGSRKGGIQAGWLGEGGTLTASKPKFRQVEIKLKKDAALCYATDEQIQDTRNLESWLTRTVPEEIKFVAEDAIIEGIGGGMPLGIMNSPALISVTRTDANKILFADIITMWSRRFAGARDYVWLTHQDAMPQLDSMVIGTEAPPRFVDYGVDGVMRMKGRPVLEVEYAQTLGTSGDLVLCSLAEYQVIEKGGIQQASSIHVAFLTDETAFRFIYRIGGAPLWHSAVTPFHGTNTVSPFVALSSAT